MNDFIGKYVVLFCANYIYAGTLVGVTTEDAVLDDAVIVYETGTLTAGEWKYAEPVPSQGLWHVAKQSIESYGEAK